MIRDLNTTAPPRPGEELDLPRLAAFLDRGPVEVEQFPAGHSNLTYLVRAGGEEFVLRRPPFGSRVKSAHDMGREFRVLSKLHRVYPPAPEPLLYCEDPSVLGAPFYLMRRLRGIVLRRQWPPEITSSPETCGSISRAFIDNLALLHGVPLAEAGLADFGRPEGYVRRQIEGWSKRWTDSRTEPLGEMDDAAAWLAREMPAESEASLIHNDYKFDNVIFDPGDFTRITGVLDWEMATVGDPLMDLGTTLAYWIDARDPDPFRALAFAPTWRSGFPTRPEVVARYQERTGRSVPRPVFYYVYGLFKLAVILQQIYYRYVHGHTTDERFAVFRTTVRELARQSVRAIEADSV